MCGVDGKVGWGPPSYLKKCESDETDEELGGPNAGREEKSISNLGGGGGSVLNLE